MLYDTVVAEARRNDAFDDVRAAALDRARWLVDLLERGRAVHRAVSQTQNYLRTLDERRESILARYGVDTRRASATVVIGHPQYVSDGVTPQQVAETLRTYNTHMARIEVITFETLLESAERMLALSTPDQTSGDIEGHTA
ncbi:Shedu anti-phage system protein SduA domain-containing protein [Streptomyces sp. NPDC058864]